MNREIRLTFDFFELPYSNDCKDAYVEVNDGPFDSNELVGKFCGSKKPFTIISTSWDLRVEFVSTGRSKYAGFKASYETRRE